MAKAIRNNINVKGISVNSQEVKISQYADDTTLILDGSLESLSYSLDLLDDFGKVSGLKLNDRKTEAVWMGSGIGNDQITLPVLKSLVVSQLVYLLTPLKSNYSALTEINKLFYTFLWKGKGDKIKRNVTINDYWDGGLKIKMVAIFSCNGSLKGVPSSVTHARVFDLNFKKSGRRFQV